MHRKLKRGSTHLQTHTHTHVCTYTHVHARTHTHRAWHGPGTTGDAPRTSAHAHLAGQTGAGSVSAGSPCRCLGEGGARGPELPARGAALQVPLGSSGPPRCWGRFLEENLSVAQHSASPGPPRPPSPLLDVPQAHRVGRDSPLQPVQSCGTEFSHHSLRVSMPLGGKYKRCLCLKPNMGVSGSPGLCPSFGPGLLATEGWAETRGRPPSYARHGSSV